jgi:hypothetical protein
VNRQNMAQPQPKVTPPSQGAVLCRKCACGQHAGGSECGECRKKNQILHRKASSTGPTDVPAVVHDTLSSPGQRLDARARALLEPRFDHDFSNVRVHADATAADSASAVGALAYTVGRHVVFGARQYAPYTAEGLRLMAHELSHVVQQSRAHTESNLQGSLEIGQPGDAAEREADQVAEEMASGVAPRAKTELRFATGAAVPSLQRQPAEDKPPVSHSLGMRPRNQSGFDLLLQKHRVDSFLTEHKFAVGPNGLPSLDGRPTTLDAVIDAAVQPLVAPIPRSIVEDRVNTRWQEMVQKALPVQASVLVHPPAQIISSARLQEAEKTSQHAEMMGTLRQETELSKEEESQSTRPSERAKITSTLRQEAERNKQEKSQSTRYETQIENKRIGTGGIAIGGKDTVEQVPGGIEASSSSVISLYGKTRLGPRFYDAEKIAHFVFVKEISGELGVGQQTKGLQSSLLLVRQLAISLISFELENNKKKLGLDINLSAVGEQQVVGAGGGRKTNSEYGGIFESEVKYYPKRIAPVFLSFWGNIKWSRTSDGGAVFQPGQWTFGIGASVGLTFGK